MLVFIIWNFSLPHNIDHKAEYRSWCSLAVYNNFSCFVRRFRSLTWMQNGFYISKKESSEMIQLWWVDIGSSSGKKFIVKDISTLFAICHVILLHRFLFVWLVVVVFLRGVNKTIIYTHCSSLYCAAFFCRAIMFKMAIMFVMLFRMRNGLNRVVLAILSFFQHSSLSLSLSLSLYCIRSLYLCCVLCAIALTVQLHTCIRDEQYWCARVQTHCGWWYTHIVG